MIFAAPAMTAVVMISVFAAVSAARAEFKCSKKNNETPEMGPLRSQRAADQGKHLYFKEDGKGIRNSVGWCYAFATADLVSHKLKRRVSAADIGINYNHFVGSKDPSGKTAGLRKEMGMYEGGIEHEALHATNHRAKGFCPEEVLKSDGYGTYAQNDSLLQSLRLTSNVHRDRHQAECTFSTTAAGKILTQLKVGDVAAITEKFENDQTRKWYELAQANCKGKRIKLPDGTKIRRLQKKDGFERRLAEMDSQLERDSVATVAFDLAHLPLSSPYWNKMPHSMRMAFSVDHALTVVGREIDPATGKCMYKFRNSWGTVCNEKEDWNAGCKNGYLYVPRDEMKHALGQVTWLE
jgi:hypothetical protein